MDFSLSKEHEMARQLFKDFAEKEVKPLAQEIDEHLLSHHRFLQHYRTHISAYAYPPDTAPLAN